MPFIITSTTFADEFNTGTTSSFTNGNLADEWTAVINVEYSNIIDADSSPLLNIEAGDASALQIQGNQYSGKQGFLLDNNVINVYSNEINEYRFSNLVGAEITVSGYNTADAALNTTFTILDVIGGTTGGYIVVCNESLAQTTKNGNKGRIAITEAITSTYLDYRASGSGNNNDYTPTIEINGNQSANFSTTTATLDATNVTPVSIPFTFNGAYQTGGLTFTGVSIANDIQSFKLTHTFRFAPISIYNDSQNEPSTFIGINNPDYQNLFNLSGVAKYGFNGSFSNKVTSGIDLPFATNIYNPTISIYGRNYLGASTNYSISNLAIVRTSDSYVTSLPIVEEKFTCSFNIDSTTAVFSNSNTLVKIGIENLPETIDNTEDYEQTFLSDYAIELLGAAAGTGNATGDALSISNYTATFNSTTQISVSFDVDFTANAQTQIDLNSEPFFSIYAVTQNHTLDYTNSDRAILNVFSGVGIQKVLVDPITVVDTKFIKPVADNYTDGVDEADLSGHPVQLLTAVTRFNSDWTDRANLRIDTITQRLVLKNTSTLEEILLDGTSIPVNSFTLINSEYPNANYNVKKGFNIPNSEIRNKVVLLNNSTLDSGDTHYYDVSFPFFIRWEEYTELLMNNISSTILDTSLPFDGKNYDVNRIDALANWELSYRITFNCSEGSTNFEQDFDYTIPTNTYDTHPLVVSRSIQAYTEDGLTLQPTLASGLQVIDSELNTYIKSTFEMSSAPTNIDTFDIEIYAEAFENGSPTKIQRISSFNDLKNNSWFTDTGAGDGKVLKSIDGVNAIGVCLVDFNKLAKFDKYRIYSTFYNPTTISYKSISLDGSTEILQYANVTPFQIEYNVPFTISSYVYFNTLSVTKYIFDKLGGGSGDDGYSIFVLSNGAVSATKTTTNGSGTGTTSFKTNTGIITAGNWYHITVTNDGTSSSTGWNIYIDAVASTRASGGSSCVASINNSLPFYWGSRGSTSSANILDGNVCQLSIWDKELSQTEVTELYNSGSVYDVETHSAAANLTVYSPVISTDDLTGTTGSVQELINGNDATPSNTDSSNLTSDLP